MNSARDDVFGKEDFFMQVKDRLFEALNNQIEGDVLDSDLSRSLYSSGASLYRIKPRAIVQPQSTKDLVATIRFAREHTENNDEIAVYSLAQNGELSCKVEDRGSNYSNEFFKILTDHFSKGDNSLNLSMGIGLAVSQMIMEAHGGNLIFEKTPDKRGCLTMVFPTGESSS